MLMSRGKDRAQVFQSLTAVAVFFQHLSAAAYETYALTTMISAVDLRMLCTPGMNLGVGTVTIRIRRILVAIRDLHPPRLELRKAAEIARAAKAAVDKLTCDALVLKPAGFRSSVGAREFKESRASAAVAA